MLSDNCDPSLGRLLDLADLLRSAGLAHAVVGAVAMAGHGIVRPTGDLDILLTSSRVDGRQNARVLFEVLKACGVNGSETPFVPDAGQLRRGCELRYVTGFGQFDLVGVSLPDSISRRLVVRRALDREVLGRRIRLCSRSDLIAIKSGTGIVKDAQDVDLLESLSDRDSE